MLGIEPGASGREAGMLPLRSPLNPLFFLSDRDAEGVRRRLGVGRHSPSGKAFQEEPRDKEMSPTIVKQFCACQDLLVIGRLKQKCFCLNVIKPLSQPF